MDQEANSLAALGITAAAEHVYRALLTGENPGAVPPEAVEELRRHRLVVESGGRLHPLSLETALARWEQERADETSRGRALARELVEMYEQFAVAQSGFFEVLRGTEQARAAFRELQFGAREFVHSLERGPYLTGPEVVVSYEQEDTAGRGVTYRTLYRQQELSQPGMLELIQQSVEMGEEARVYSDVPLRMMIVDNENALVVLPQPMEQLAGWASVHSTDGLLVRQSPLLDVLVRVFESYWGRGSSLEALGTARFDGTPGERQVLDLLGSGLTDSAIARALGVSERTVYRRIAALEERIGVSGRYLLGVEAAKRGWI